MLPISLSLRQAAEQIRLGELSPAELTDAVLAQIAELDPSLSAYTWLLEEEAREEARRRTDELRSSSELGPLHGIPVAVKDVIDVAGAPTRAGSKASDPNPVAADAEVVARLRAAGAVILGKTVTHEYAYGVVSPPASNPWDRTRIPGGSSGGSAVAVRTGMAVAALGSDTSGSVRIPSALCGIVGLKPTYGLLPRRGLVPLSWSMDHVGVMAREADDILPVLDAVAGPDAMDEGSISEARWRRLGPLRSSTSLHDLAGVRIGVPDAYFWDGIASAVRVPLERALNVLEELGAQIQSVSLPAVERAMDAQYAILRPESASFHARRIDDLGHLLNERLRALLELGRTIPATAYIDAQRVRARTRSAFQSAFESVDVIAAPTCPQTAPEKGVNEVNIDGESEWLSPALVRLSVPASLAGVPAVSVPCGFDDGLPVALQLIGGPYLDANLLAVAQRYLDEAAHHRSEPEMMPSSLARTPKQSSDVDGEGRR